MLAVGPRWVTLLALGGCLVSGCAGAPRTAPTASPRPSGVLWLIFVDDLHVRFSDTGLLRNLVRTISTQLLAQGDLLAARAVVSPRFSIDTTPDHEWLIRRTRDLNGNGLRLGDVIHGVGWVDEVSYRSSVALAAACEAITSIADVPDRRKAAIYISNGYLRFHAGHGPQCDRPVGLIAVAKAAGVQVFPIDTRLISGPPTPDLGVDADVWRHYWNTSQESLRLLARDTGGFARLDNTDLVAWLQQVSRAVRH
ncbi:MAG TPA: hypothetical protein VMO26_19600 [Vicinamibacterales bacterium]|nr:hypothetical protein [Vicinamibacterales bacterium]